MSKKLFSEEEIKILNKNKYVKNVTTKGITYLTYSNHKRAYLSTIKDSSINEILTHNVSTSLKLDIVLDTIDILSKNIGDSLHKDAFIHSDQSSHYTSLRFQKS